jgi:PKHD-type hydroxylase
MPFHIPNLLTPAQVDEIRTAINDLDFADGLRTASAGLRKVKKNREAIGSETSKRLDAIIQGALRANQQFQVVAVPFRVQPFMFSSYVPGEFYGDHVDNAIMGMGTDDPLRADMSMTLFLSDPSEYDGGELMIETDVSPLAYKLPPGHAVVYPTYSLHRVQPVTRGERLAAITWIQSYVRSAQRRQALIDISLVLGWMSGSGQAQDHPEFQRLDKVRHNLIRMWSEF